jgi:LacI family transcriptional regulator
LRYTLLDIAREAGVSPATVDRVLNNRSGVKSRTRDAVLGTAKRLGYVSEQQVSPDQIVRLRFILPMGTNSFVKSLQEHIEQQAAQRPELDVEISSIAGFDVDSLASAIRAATGACHGIGIIALDHPTVREAIREAAASGVKLITMASDISNVARVAYVGVDNRQAGRLAGYILGRFLGTQSTAKVAVFAGSLSYRGHEEREMGFRHILKTEFPKLEIVALSEMRDDRERAFREAGLALDTHPDLAAIYNIGAGNQGIAAALKQRNREKTTLFIGHEATRSNRDLLLDGTMDALIDQNPRVEAREALNILTAAVRSATYEPHQPRLQIIFKENIPDY